MDNFNNDDQYTLNIQSCMTDRSLPAVLRELFADLHKNGYINTGKFFSELSDTDVETLSALSDYTHPDADATPEQVDRGMQHMALLGMALMVGEGQELSEASCELGLKLAISYTAIESLHRQGLVDVLHENWTMDLDDTKPIVKLREQ